MLVYQRVNLHFPMVFLWFSYGFCITNPWWPVVAGRGWSWDLWLSKDKTSSSFVCVGPHATPGVQVGPFLKVAEKCPFGNPGDSIAFPIGKSEKSMGNIMNHQRGCLMMFWNGAMSNSLHMSFRGNGWKIPGDHLTCWIRTGAMVPSVPGFWP